MEEEEHTIVQFVKMLRKLLEKLRIKKRAPNRFLRFYYHNKRRLLRERKGEYYNKKKEGICVRCSKPIVKGIIFCLYHQEKQKGYNTKSRHESAGKHLV